MKEIGIKLADGKFYPLLEEGVSSKKTIELITVTKNQPKVKVDILRTESSKQENTECLGTLVLDSIEPHNKVTLSLSVGIDNMGTIKVEIRDPKTEKKSQLQIENSIKEDTFLYDGFVDSTYGNFIRLQAQKSLEDEKYFRKKVSSSARIRKQSIGKRG